MKFNKIYIEITNICGLQCSFCPTKAMQNKTISLTSFETILNQVKNYTNIITYHIFGDPLCISNLEEYLDITHKYKLKVEIVTTGYYLNKHDLNIFLHPAIKQINFSLNSFDKNDMKMSLNEYLNSMFLLCDLKLNNKIHNFINFRLWNLDAINSDAKFNKQVLELLTNKFNVNLNDISYDKPIRLENQILLDFDNYFQWPSLDSNYSSDAPCYGLRSHFGILADGRVVPCCLDSYGIITLGNIFEQNLKDILESKRTTSIINGFKNGIAVEELCKKCSFKDRFLGNS